jgi:hypothetical protein
MRSLKAVALLFIVALATVVHAQVSPWILENPAALKVGKASAHLGSCMVWIKKDDGEKDAGMVLLHTYAEPQGSDRIYHDVILLPKRDGKVPGFFSRILGVQNQIRMVKVSELWIKARDYKHPTKAVANFVGPDFFWNQCGKALPLLPPSMLFDLHGWRGLPVPNIEQQEAKK